MNEEAERLAKIIADAIEKFEANTDVVDKEGMARFVARMVISRGWKRQT